MDESDMWDSLTSLVSLNAHTPPRSPAAPPIPTTPEPPSETLWWNQHTSSPVLQVRLDGEIAGPSDLVTTSALDTFLPSHVLSGRIQKPYKHRPHQQPRPQPLLPTSSSPLSPYTPPNPIKPEPSLHPSPAALPPPHIPAPVTTAHIAPVISSTPPLAMSPPMPAPVPAPSPTLSLSPATVVHAAAPTRPVKAPIAKPAPPLSAAARATPFSPPGDLPTLKEKRQREARQFSKDSLQNLEGTTSAEVRKMSNAERELVLYKRKLRNRESARRSRQKRQATIAELQDDVDDLTHLSSRMIDVAIALKNENMVLRDQLNCRAHDSKNLRRFGAAKGPPAGDDAHPPQATLNKMKLGG